MMGPELLVERVLGRENRPMALARKQLSNFSDLAQSETVPSSLALVSGRQTFRLAESSLRPAMTVLLEVPKEDRPPMLK